MPKTAKSKSLCAGCYHDDYNHGFMGVKECWSFDSAKVIKRIPIDVDRRPPYDKKAAKPMMSCYNRKRMVYVTPDALDSQGFWKR